MTKILHIISSPRAEGTVRLTLDWLQSTEGLSQAVYAFSAEPAHLTTELKTHAVSYHETTGFPAGWIKYPWIVWQVWQRVSAEKPDLVICWCNGFSGPALLGAFIAGARALLSHAGNPPTSTVKGQIHGWLTASVVWALGGRMICCSRYVARQFLDTACFPESILAVVWNCAQIDDIHRRAGQVRDNRNRNSEVVLMVATLEPHKDHATLIKAFVRVQQLRPKAELWLAGDGSLRSALTEQARQLGLGDSVKFLGSRNDVPELLGQSDLFVFATTRQEGLGTVLVEALAAGLPIVASDVPACREVLQDGRWGCLVPAHDAGELAASINDALSSASRSGVEPARESFLAAFSVAAMQEAYLHPVMNRSQKHDRSEAQFVI